MAGLVILLIGYAASHESLRKLRALETTLDRVSRGDDAARVPVQGDGDQIDRIARRVNAHLDRLSGLMTTTRATAAAIAHDLKTPLSRAQLALQSARGLIENGRDAQDSLERIETELGRPPVGPARSGSRTLDLDLLAAGDCIEGVDPSGNAPSGVGAPGSSGIGTSAPVCPEPESADARAELILPHPRLHLRSFVLVPLCEIDPHWRHPLLGRTAASLLAELDVPPGSVRLHGSLGLEPAGSGPYPWRQLPARGGI